MKENYNLYSTPQKQSQIGILVEIIYAFQNAARRFWPLFIFLFIKVKSFGIIYILLATIIILILIAVFGYLNYKNFLFQINESDQEFILNKGVFNKKRIAIKFSRIQQVNINQSFLQKLIDVYQIEIETAGSSKEEVKIKAVSKDVAQHIRNRLLVENTMILDEATELKSDEKSDSSKTILVNIPIKNLLKVALTSEYFKSLWLVSVFFFASYNKLKEVFFNDKETENKVLNYISKFNPEQYLIALIVAGIILIFVFNLIRTFIVYYDFNIGLKENSLQFSYGLFNKKNTLIQLTKVQKITVVRNFFQKLMNIERMYISQASSNIEKDKKATIHIPGINLNERNEILKLIYGALPQTGAIITPTFNRVLSSVYKFILIPIIIFVIIATIKSEWNMFLISTPVYLMIAFILIYISYKNNSISIHDSFIIKQSGIWDIKREIITPDKIQSITTLQYLWHVKLNIGHLKLHTAAGVIVFKFGDFSKINNYVNGWLYHVESTNKDWM